MASTKGMADRQAFGGDTVGSSPCGIGGLRRTCPSFMRSSRMAMRSSVRGLRQLVDGHHCQAVEKLSWAGKMGVRKASRPRDPLYTRPFSSVNLRSNRKPARQTEFFTACCGNSIRNDIGRQARAACQRYRCMEQKIHRRRQAI